MIAGTGLWVVLPLGLVAFVCVLGKHEANCPFASLTRPADLLLSCLWETPCLLCPFCFCGHFRPEHDLLPDPFAVTPHGELCFAGRSHVNGGPCQGVLPDGQTWHRARQEQVEVRGWGREAPLGQGMGCTEKDWVPQGTFRHHVHGVPATSQDKNTQVFLKVRFPSS